MTFYSIIFGILFVAACRQLLLFPPAEPSFWMAATIATLIFNDVLYTSHTLETRGVKKYVLAMKFIDLGNFLLLGVALVVLNPGQNLIDADVSGWLTERPVSFFWGLLFAYWMLSIVWNILGGLYRKSPRRRWGSGVVAVILLVTWLAVARDWGVLWPPILALSVSATYATVWKWLEGLRQNSGDERPARDHPGI